MSDTSPVTTTVTDRIALVTGANKGLGFATAGHLLELGYTVYVGARDAKRGQRAATRFGTRFVQIDVTDDASVAAAMGVIAKRDGRLDVLVNNAGIAITAFGPDTEKLTAASALQEFDTNAISVIRVIQAALPLLRRSRHPVVVNVASGLGSFWAVTHPDRMESQFPAVSYAASKAAVLMITVQYAKAFPDIKFNAAEPGFTATDMTAGLGLAGGQPVAEGAETIVRLATIGKDGPTGTFHGNAGVLAW